MRGPWLEGTGREELLVYEVFFTNRQTDARINLEIEVEWVYGDTGSLRQRFRYPHDFPFPDFPAPIEPGASAHGAIAFYTSHLPFVFTDEGDYISAGGAGLRMIFKDFVSGKSVSRAL